MNIPESIRNLAGKYGWPDVKYCGTWRSYQVFSAYDREMAGCIGEPCILLLSSDSEARLAFPEEWRACLAELPEDERTNRFGSILF